MDLLQISKDLKLSGSDSMVPTKDLVITYRDYMNVVQGSCWINRIDSYVVDEEEVKFVVSSYIVGEKKLLLGI